MFKRHMIMAPEGEASSGGLASSAEIFENADANETFDNLEYESESSKKIGEEFKDKFKEKIERAKKAKDAREEDDEPKAKAKKEPKEAKKGSDIDTLPDNEETDLDGKEVKPKEKKAEEKEDEEESELPKKEEEKAAEDKAKKLKIRMSDGLYGIESDAKIRVKIDGDYQEVPVQELINNYSGKTAWDKKFTEIGQEKKQLEVQTKELTKKQQLINSTVTETLSHFDDINKNPVDAITFLADKAGKDPFTIWKRTLEANLDEIEKLMALDEVGRENYYLKKEKEFRTKSEEARKEAFHKEQAFNQALSKLDSLRQAQGVSEEQFLQALDELESDGTDTSKMSDEALVDYASLKPHVTTVQDILEPFEDSISDTNYSKVVQKLARELRSGEFTKEQLIEWARKEFADEDLKDFTQRTNNVQKRTTKETPRVPEKLETLDFED